MLLDLCVCSEFAHISPSGLPWLIQNRFKWLNVFLKHVCALGSPRCNALPHDVCPEHGAHPVPALAPQPRRTRAGPRTPAAPCCKRWRARQLRPTDTGLNINSGYHQELNAKINPTWNWMGNSVSSEWVEWDETKQLDSGHRVGSAFQPPAGKLAL